MPVSTHLMYAVLSLGLIFLQQQPAERNSAADKADGLTGSISGTAINATTRAPIAAMPVSVAGSEQSMTVTTDTNGHYSFAGLRGGTWRVFATRTQGFLRQSDVIGLRAGENVDGVDLVLDREGVIGGRVVDRDKNPISGAMVSVRAHGYRNGRASLMSFHSARTDAAGKFRVQHLLPGQYILEVEPRPLPVRTYQATDTEGDDLADNEDKPPLMTDVRTYYVNAPSMDGAIPINIAPSQQIEETVVTLLRGNTFWVTSRVVDLDDSGLIQMKTRILESYPFSQSTVAYGAAKSGDRVEVCGVPPGQYRIIATGQDRQGKLSFASAFFAVGDRNVPVPSLNLSPARPVTGTITIADGKDAGPAAVLGNLQIRLDPKDRIAYADERTIANVEASGRFVIPAAVMDQYWLQISGFQPVIT